ncbi:MAG: hypothetical protein SangKO_062460 [Sandaracinaceae bacterium]
MSEPVAASEPSAALRFVYGGVSFDVHPSAGVAWSLTPSLLSLRTSALDAPTLAHVHCAVAPDPSLGAPRPSVRVDAHWTGENGRVETGRARASLRALTAGRYAASGQVAPSADGCSDLLTSLASVLAVREGGLVLHATGIAIDESGVLFLGPSGAGKSTAANLCSQASWFAADRAIVFPHGGAWYVSGLPGGEDPSLPRADASPRALAGILRVRQAEAVGVCFASPIEAFRILRESCQVARGLENEQRVLATIESLARSVRLGFIDTVLGRDPSDLVRQFAEGART